MTALITHAAYPPLLVLLLAVLLDAVWRWPASTHPMTLFKYLARQMAGRVCPAPHYPPLQHRISGSLGAFMLIVPFAVTLILLISLAQYPVFFEAIVLICVLDYKSVRYQYDKVTKTVGQNKKMLAREMVGPLVARECARLTDIGIAKAAIESLLLRFYYLYCGVIFWFLVSGAGGALIYRLLLELSWQWNTRMTRFALFGQPVSMLVRLLRLPPALCGALIMALVTSPVAALGGLRQTFRTDITSALLAMFGRSHDILLGGPAFYNGKKRRDERVGGQRDVRYSDMIYARRAIYRAMILVVTLAGLSMWVYAVIIRTGQAG